MNKNPGAASALSASLVALLLAGCSSEPKPPKPPPPPPVCLAVDASKLDYAPGPIFVTEEPVEDLVKRTDLHLKERLRERGVPLGEGPCRADVHTLLTLRFDKLHTSYAGVFSTVIGFRVRDMKLHYQVTMQAPGAKDMIWDFPDDRQAETVDELAEKIAGKVSGWAARLY